MSTTNNTFTESTANLAETAVMASASPAPSFQPRVEQAEAIILSHDQLAAALSHNPAVPYITVNEPASAGPDADLNQQLDDFTDQLPVSAAADSVQAGEHDEQFCDHAKRAIMRYYGASIISEYLQGRYLFFLQTERAKPGTGKFVADLAQLREAGALLLSNATAYRRIFNYKIVREGLADLLASRSLSQAEKDKWPGGITELTVDDFEEALEQRKAADEGALEFEAMIEEAKQKQKKLKQEQGGTTTLNLQFFGLTDADKKRLRDAFAALVQAKGKVSASQFVVNVLCMVAQGGKAVSA